MLALGLSPLLAAAITWRGIFYLYGGLSLLFCPVLFVFAAASPEAHRFISQVRILNCGIATVSFSNSIAFTRSLSEITLLAHARPVCPQHSTVYRGAEWQAILHFSRLRVRILSSTLLGFLCSRICRRILRPLVCHSNC